MEDELLRHPSPFKNESLASYIFRLSKENCCETHWLFNLFGMPQYNNIRYLNYIHTDTVYYEIFKRTKVPLDTLKAMTVHRFSLDLWNANMRNPQNDFYFKQNINMNCVKYCPECLEEQQYQRINWLINFITICLKHKTILLEMCLKCGKLITHEEVIRGYCECRAKLSEAKAQNCYNSFILRNQRYLYIIFSISENGRISNKLPHNISNLEFLYIMYFFYLVFETYGEHLFQRKQVWKGCPAQDNLKKVYLAERILEKWPGELYLLLDELNNLNHFWMHKFLDKYFQYNLSPINVIQRYIRDVSTVSFFMVRIWEYFQNNYNYNFMKKILAPILIEDKYIEVSIAEKIFCISPRNLNRCFGKSRISGKDVVDLEPIIKFFKFFIDRGQYYFNFRFGGANSLGHEKDENGYNTINVICSKYRKRDLTILDLLNVIKEKDIEVKINPLANGTRMILLPENTVLNCIIKGV